MAYGTADHIPIMGIVGSVMWTLPPGREEHQAETGRGGGQESAADRWTSDCAIIARGWSLRSDRNGG